MTLVLAIAVAVFLVAVVATVRALRHPWVSPPATEDAELAALERSPDPMLRTLARLSRRVTLGEQFHRRLRLVVRLLVVALVVELVVSVVVVVTVFEVRHEADRRDADRLERAVATCQQANETAARIDAGNEAKQALADALAALQHDEIDAILGPLDSTPSTDPATQAFLDRYHAGRAAVEAAEATARAKIAAAHVPTRDCSPAGIDAFLSTTTTSSSSTGG